MTRTVIKKMELNMVCTKLKLIACYSIKFNYSYKTKTKFIAHAKTKNFYLVNLFQIKTRTKI